MPTMQHIGLIMDGNSTWAKKNNLDIFEGYLEGMRNLARIVCHINELKIPYATCYAFSSENWSRPNTWINKFMQLSLNFMESDNAINKVLDSNIKLKAIGNLGKLPVELQNSIMKYEQITKNNTGTTMLLAMSYGGRDEIVRAVNKALDKNLPINEHTITQNLDTSNIPDPDLIIRTSGKKRLSNFMLWQASYSEFYSSDLFWPEFSKAELQKAICDFNTRIRTYGTQND